MSKTTEHNRYTYGFRQHLDINDVQDTLTLAIIGAENLHGRSKVRLDGWWRLDRQRRKCVIDASTPVGQDIAQPRGSHLRRRIVHRLFRERPH